MCTVTFGMVSNTMYYYTIAIDKVFLQTAGTGVAFTQMTTMEDIWKVLHDQLYSSNSICFCLLYTSPSPRDS